MPHCTRYGECSIDVIVRNEIVDRAKPGDKARFTGCLIVVPDVSQLSMASAAPGGVGSDTIALAS